MYLVSMYAYHALIHASVCILNQTSSRGKGGGLRAISHGDVGEVGGGNKGREVHRNERRKEHRGMRGAGGESTMSRDFGLARLNP